MEQIISSSFKLFRADETQFCFVIVVAVCQFTEHETGKFKLAEFDLRKLEFWNPSMKEMNILEVLRYEIDENITILQSGKIDEAIEAAAEKWATDEWNKELEQEHIERCHNKGYAHRTKEND